MARVHQRRTVSRSNTPQSPPRQYKPAQSQSPQTRRSTRSRSHTGRAVTPPLKSRNLEKPLAVVEEENDTVEVALQEEAPRSSPDHENDNEEIDSELSAGLSNMSSDDDIEAQIAELDDDLIIDNLPALLYDATNILTLIESDASASLLNDLRSTKTVAGKRYRNFRARFDVSSDPCRSNGFLLIDRILHKLGKTAQVELVQWRPDAILYMANLAIAVSDLVTGSDIQVRDTLEFMFNNFPGRYLMGSLISTPENIDVAATELIGETIDISLSLRTHFLLLSIQEHIYSEAFNPDIVLSQLFYEEEGRLRGFEEVTDTDLLERISGACRQRVRDIRAFFRKSSKKPFDLEKLKQQYPWQDFLLSFINWSRQRKLELTSQISAQGGVDAIVQALVNDQQEPVEMEIAPQIQSVTAPAAHETINRTPTQSRHSLPKFSSAKAQKLNELKARQAAEADRPDSSDESASNSVDEEEAEDEEEEEIEEGSVQGVESHDERAPELEIGETPRRNQASVSDLDPVPAAGSEASLDEEIHPPAGQDAVPSPYGALADAEVQLEPETEAPPRSGQPSPPPPTQGSIVPTQETLEVLAVYERQKRQSNKENINTMRRFDQRQPGAKRVEWDDADADDRRRHDEVGDDSSEEFELDTRKVKRQRIDQQSLARQADSADDDDSDTDLPSSSRILKGTAPRVRANHPPPSAQPRPSQSPVRHRTTDVDNRDRPQPSPPSSASQRQLTTQHQSTGPSSPPPATQAQRANLQAKVVVRRLVKPTLKKSQTRTPWSSAEVNRLLDLIETYGTSWSTLMEQDRDHPEGPEFQSRGQVGIRDKARNIKMDFLKACQPLPPGFGAVVLKASDYQKLDDLGVPYVRHERERGPTATTAADEDEE